MKIFKKKPIALVLAHVIGVGSGFAVSQGALAQAVGVQEEPRQIGKIQVTGTSIARVAAEGGLPVITLDRSYIEQSGATSATELIQSLPSMQNFVPASSSVNGAGAGTTTASLHALPSKYTLVLVDGQRTPAVGLGAIQGGGTGVNIESIPLDAVERVEILTDGASAVYGSDAIAGVVNFILKKTETTGNAYVNVTVPQNHGGGGWNAGISKGWGDLETDKWNVLVTYSHDRANPLLANQRDFSNIGAYRPFTQNGVRYIYNGATSNTYPANISFSAVPNGSAPGTPSTQYSINPYYRLNGNCGTSFASVITDPTGTGALKAVGESCRFNYAATVQDIPETERNSGVVKGTLRINDTTTVWGTFLLSNVNVVSQYAAPAQPLVISPTKLAPLYNAYVVPFLTANNLTQAGNNPQIGYRAVSQGGRADNYETDWRHLSFGIDGSGWGWDYHAYAVIAQTKQSDTTAGGYTDLDGFSGAVNAGLFDPVLATGAASIVPFILHTQISQTKSELSTVHFNAQHDLWNMGGGASIIAVGADYQWNKYSIGYGPYGLVNSGYSTQDDLTSTAIGGPGGSVPIDAKRNNWGIYTELFVPVLKNLEFTGSVRYDSYDKVQSGYVFSNTPDSNGVFQQIANADLGNTFDDTTYKITGRWTPIDTLLIRGSYGTGFKAPTLGDMAGPLVFGGSTSNSYTCPLPGNPSCLPGSAQYDLLAGPNGLSGSQGLKPEKSKQWTVGARWDAFKGFSVGADLWDVKITDQVLSQGIAEQVGFGNPQQYASLFVAPYVDPVGGFSTIAFQQVPFNGGNAEYQGVDYDVSYKLPTQYGLFSAQWTGTQMIKAQYTFGPGQPVLTDLGKYGPDQVVVFRTTMQLILGLQTGAWNNSLTGHYKSGYQDQDFTNGPPNVFLQNPDGSLGPNVTFGHLQVGSYTTFDWQTQYNVNKNLRLTFGITNLFDKDPPLSLQSGGGGNQGGYDGRYADPTGRAFYVRGAIRW